MKYFSILLKPASSLCNMRCRYCFYCDVAENREVFSYGIMNEATAAALLDRVFTYLTPPATVTFAFQGGEPTVAGLDFFKMFTALADQKNEERFILQYAIQTNGLTIDRDWCKLLKKYDFLVGLSLDPGGKLHVAHRLDGKKNGTFSRVRKTAQLLEETGVSYNILSTVTRQMAQHPQEVFRFYKNSGFRYIQLTPCLKALDAEENAPFDLTPRLFASFLKQFFALWYQSLREGDYISVRMFDNLVRQFRGEPAEQCGMSGECTPQFVVEGDGSVFPCDFYVLDPYKSGNVNENTVEEIGKSEGMLQFVRDQKPRPPICDSCRFLPICGGGCRRYRDFYHEEEGYCPYADFLSEAAPVLVQLARMS